MVDEPHAAGLFAPAFIGEDTLMVTMDAINRRFGQSAVGLTAGGL
jgi:hypothetical protein